MRRLLALAAAALAGCAGSPPHPPDAAVLDAGPDAGVDAGLDVGVDAGSPSRCLLLNDPEVRFGDVELECSATRSVSFFNACADALRITAAEVSGGAFTLTPTVFPLVLDAGASGSLELRATPLSLGPSPGSLRLEADDGFALALLSSQGVGPTLITDRFRQETASRPLVTFLVDASPSFVVRRPTVRAALVDWAQQQRTADCFRPRLSVAPAEGGAVVTRSASDAGATLFELRGDGGVEGFLSALDELPVGTETESCIAPAIALAEACRSTPGPPGATNGKTRCASPRPLATARSSRSRPERPADPEAFRVTEVGRRFLKGEGCARRSKLIHITACSPRT